MVAPDRGPAAGRPPDPRLLRYPARPAAGVSLAGKGRFDAVLATQATESAPRDSQGSAGVGVAVVDTSCTLYPLDGDFLHRVPSLSMHREPDLAWLEAASLVRAEPRWPPHATGHPPESMNGKSVRWPGRPGDLQHHFPWIPPTMIVGVSHGVSRTVFTGASA